MGWNLIKTSLSEFTPSNTFFIGQVFNWTYVSERYVGCLSNKLLEIRTTDLGFEWKLTPQGSEQEVVKFLNLDIDLLECYQEWKKDALFEEAWKVKPGVRIVKQNAFECTMAFIVSQNNNVKRIERNLNSIRTAYGELITEKHGKKWYSFPTPEQLSLATREDLLKLGLGYRAKYIVGAVRKIIDNGGENWLEGLKELPQEEAKSNLMQLDGVGPKVADCILLFGLNKFSVVPIDIHMWRISQNHYMKKKTDKLNKKSYSMAVEAIQEALGSYAGWAHSFLYATSLSKSLKRKIK